MNHQKRVSINNGGLKVLSKKVENSELICEIIKTDRTLIIANSVPPRNQGLSESMNHDFSLETKSTNFTSRKYPSRFFSKNHTL